MQSKLTLFRYPRTRDKEDVSKGNAFEIIPARCFIVFHRSTRKFLKDVITQYPRLITCNLISSYNIKNHVPADEQEQRTGLYKEQWDTSLADHLLCNFCYSNKKSPKEYCLPKQHFSSTFGRWD
ncbi:hypothetical protein V1477_021138 [Vespula maculifrons]|uniref:Uncharacterized protein n=1 Tax=Vespula maculifrons TaxID=7453 RepID=A0ABD2AHW9_VESMC